MKKLEDGTEYLFRTEERDKDGNLVKSVRYAKDGKTVERVREFKMFPAGANTPARNVVASEICYGKNGEVIYKRTAHADGLGYDTERLEGNIWEKATYVTHLDGKRFKPMVTSGIITDAKTGNKIAEAQFGSKGEDDIVLYRKFDKKTGTKMVEEMQRLSDDTYKATEFGQGQSRRVFIFKEIEGQEDEILQFERYDSQGRLRESFLKNEDGRTVTKKIDKKGRERIIENDGEEMISRTYTKDGKKYQQYQRSDGGFNIFRDGEHVGLVRHPAAPNETRFTLEDGSVSRMTYDENSRKLKKVVIPSARDGARIECTYDEFGQLATRTTKNYFGTKTETFSKGELVKSEEVDSDGTIALSKFYDRKSNVRLLTVENNPDGSTEIVVHFSREQVTPEGLHYNFKPIKFDKKGDIIPHSYSNTGSLGDIDAMRKILYELGEDDLLRKYYRPNGQASLF
ncbi:MAG: hypothetical protein NC390_05420 [Fusobacterium sp.]|nr:hypothetical protein [Fusobacterium sp.]